MDVVLCVPDLYSAHTSTSVYVVLQNSSINLDCALYIGSYTCSGYVCPLHLIQQSAVNMQQPFAHTVHT